MYGHMISTRRDMFAVCAVAVFCLMSVSHSAPLACERLVRPLDQLDPRHLEGRRALVAGSFDNPDHQAHFKRGNSSSIDFYDANATSSATLTQSDGECQSQSYNVSFEGSTLTFNEPDQVTHIFTLLFTSCPDCMVMRFDALSKKPNAVFLFSKRREVEQEEMEQFKAQVECLNMLPPAVMDPTTELCPGRSARDAAAARTED